MPIRTDGLASVNKDRETEIDKRPAEHEKENRLYYWKYLQIVNSEFFINIIMHKNSMFGIDQTPYISYSVFNKNTSEFVHKRINSSQINMNVLEFHYEANCQSGFSFENEELSIKGLITTYNEPLPEVQLLPSLNQDGDGMWKVLIFKGIFEGYIKTSFFEGLFTANVYQDEQWSNSELQVSLKRWVWYSVIDKGIPYVHFSIESTNGFVKSISIYGYDEIIQKVSDTFNIDVYNSIISVRERSECINSPIEKESMFSLCSENRIRNRVDEEYGAYYFNYKRYVTKSVDGLNINGACEIMSFEKKHIT